MKEIPIIHKNSKDIFTIKIDDEDYDKVNQFTWTLNPKGYARSNKNVFIHHLIIGNRISENLVVDHKNHDKLDNRKENIHHVSKSHNTQNSRRKNKQGFTGIFKMKNEKFRASVIDPIKCKKYKSKQKESALEAAKDYDILTYHFYGKFALTNCLISYDDAIKINLDDIIARKPERNLPKNIFISNSKFIIKKSYNNKWFLKTASNLEEALIKLDEINEEIKKLKTNYNNNLSITKDDLGCYILVNNNIKSYVDEKYWHKLMEYKWYINTDGYVCKTKITMHQFILKELENQKIPNDKVVDHINNNKKDNRLENLRIVSYSENNQNRKKKEGTTSKFIGVSLAGKKWRSGIIFKRKKYYLGLFESEMDAAKAYNDKARELYGDRAKFNLF